MENPIKNKQFISSDRHCLEVVRKTLTTGIKVIDKPQVRTAGRKISGFSDTI